MALLVLAFVSGLLSGALLWHLWCRDTAPPPSPPMAGSWVRLCNAKGKTVSLRQTNGDLPPYIVRYHGRHPAVRYVRIADGADGVPCYQVESK